MIADIKISPTRTVTIDLSTGFPISIPLNNGKGNPNCYWADDVAFQTIKTDSFTGSVKDGGHVNYQKVSFTPHGNGTHTECYGHITDSNASIIQCLNRYFFLAQLISVTPRQLTNGDMIIAKEDVIPHLMHNDIEALIIRTLPNSSTKLNINYSGTNPPYLDPDLCNILNQKGVNHLLVDLPSIDKELDNGLLASHKAFWGIGTTTRPGATITELVFVQNTIEDGSYMVNLQIAPFNMDATPSNPVLYAINC